MSVTDGLFNLPAAPYLYPHMVQVLRTAEIKYEADANGFPVPVAIGDDVALEDVKAYVTSPNINRTGITDRVDATILIPYDIAPVQLTDTIIVPSQPNMLPFLAGTYQVSDGGYRPNPLHMRVFVKRPRIGEETSNNPVSA